MFVGTSLTDWAKFQPLFSLRIKQSGYLAQYQWSIGKNENKIFFCNYSGRYNVFFFQTFKKKDTHKKIYLHSTGHKGKACTSHSGTLLRVSDKEFSNPKLKFPLKVNEVFGHLVISFMATLLVVLTQIACGKWWNTQSTRKHTVVYFVLKVVKQYLHSDLSEAKATL